MRLLITVKIVLLAWVKLVTPLGEANFQALYSMVEQKVNASNSYVIPTDYSEMLRTENNLIHEFGQFDFIVVGSGAAGAVVASRLSEIKEWKILLLEAGGLPDDFLKIVGLYSYTIFSDFNWGFNSTPQANSCLGMVDKKCILSRGKVLGGCTNTNGVFYSRGHPEDYDRWAYVYKNPGWSYMDVLPYFKKSEHAIYRPIDPVFHSLNGPLVVNVTEGVPSLTNLLFGGFGELGYEPVDPNSGRQIGVARCPNAVKGNERQSTATAFLPPKVQKRPNLIISLNSFVTKLIINKRTKIAEGVQFVKNKKTYVAKARKEVILSAGSYNSPQILMLSGIGPRKHLEELKIPVIEDLPVGQNMQDHPQMFGTLLRNSKIFYDQDLEGLLKLYVDHLEPLLDVAKITAYTNFGQGDSHRSIIEFFFNVPTSTAQEDSRFNGFNEEYTAVYMAQVNTSTDAFLPIVLFHPKSVGTVTLQSSSPVDKPLIDLNFLADEEDLENYYKAIQLLIKLNATETFRKTGASIIFLDSPGCMEYKKETKPWWFCNFKHYCSESYHPTSTNRMGPDKKNFVVDHKLRVHGIRHLRVIDASIMPETVSAHTMVPTIMIGERGSDWIKADHGKHL